MAEVTARTKIKGKLFEIKVNLDEALKVKAGKGNAMTALSSPRIFSNIKKGEVAKESDLKDAFNTTDISEIARKIMVSGEIQKTQDFREGERETRIRQVINLIVKNATDQNGHPYTEERIRRASDEVHFAFDSRPAEQQMPELLAKIQAIIPIKIETKRIKLTIPAQYTGQVYGILKDYKESEEWLSNGALEAILNIPSGMLLDFYDKLNSITHGAVQSQELAEKK